ncbi:MAG: NifB/NifX family molybdenum-iron cluster-binding protein [Candidatus Zixiibacteriota bacterium]
MKIAVTSQGTDLTSKVDPRFGRAQYFIIVDTSNDDFKTIENTQNLNAVQGAGVQAAQNIVREKVDIVVSGNLGPKAYMTLNAAGIKIALWSDGTVAEAVQFVKDNRLQIIQSPNVEGHWM